MKDSRVSLLARSLVNYSISAQPGEKVLIEANDVDSRIITEIVNEVYKAGAFPIVELHEKKIDRALLMGTCVEHIELLKKYALYRMEDIDCYIGIRGLKNSFELSDIPSEKLRIYANHFSFPVHHQTRVRKTKWVVLRYPNEAMAQLASMPTEKFEDFYFNVCNLDYHKMDKAMDGLKRLMDKTDMVRLIAPNTDLTFSIKGIPTVKCSGRYNVPDGEIYTAPVRDSVNGTITYNAPSIHDGTLHENVSLTFENGRIVAFDGSHPKKLKEIFETDEGAKYVGEFAIGVNPYITKPMGDILFDEKIAGSIHFTPGAAYDQAFNGNKSSIHWDLVLMMTPQYGGGEIWFDDVLIRKDGEFILPELDCLNPGSLK